MKGGFIKLDKEMDIKKTIVTINFASIITFAPVTTLAQETVEQDIGNRIVQRLDNRRDQINDRLHTKTHRVRRSRAPSQNLGPCTSGNKRRR